MVWGCVSALVQGTLHFCDEAIDAETVHRDIGVTYTALKMMSSPMHIQQEHAMLNSVCISNALVWQKRVSATESLEQRLLQEESLHHLVTSIPK